MCWRLLHVFVMVEIRLIPVNERCGRLGNIPPQWNTVMGTKFVGKWAWTRCGTESNKTLTCLLKKIKQWTRKRRNHLLPHPGCSKPLHSLYLISWLCFFHCLKGLVRQVASSSQSDVLVPRFASDRSCRIKYERVFIFYCLFSDLFQKMNTHHFSVWNQV